MVFWCWTLSVRLCESDEWRDHCSNRLTKDFFSNISKLIVVMFNYCCCCCCLTVAGWIPCLLLTWQWPFWPFPLISLPLVRGKGWIPQECNTILILFDKRCTSAKINSILNYLKGHFVDFDDWKLFNYFPSREWLGHQETQKSFFVYSYFNIELTCYNERVPSFGKRKRLMPDWDS